VELKGEKFTRRLQTGVTGKFAFTGLAPGSYSVATLPDSYPVGYALQDLAAQNITVESGKPSSTQFTVKALRSISGRVVVYDKATLQTVPIAGVVVRFEGAFSRSQDQPHRCVYLRKPGRWDIHDRGGT